MESKSSVLFGTRKDLEEAFQFGAEGLVGTSCQKRPVEDALAVFDEMEKVKSRTYGTLISQTNLIETYLKSWDASSNFFILRLPNVD